ncbi:MAG: 50S ribosome-binding GTPase, partial [Rickettsiales bacterium]|nr:50S ribosome-binding GTPase [Rickettsiales bacterium]
MKEYTVAITGNPNTGKTSIFNSLAHQNQKVGNWPGVTVEKKDGILFQDNTKRIKIIDLPGIYSLRSASEDEIIASDFIIKNNPSMTVVVLDASRLERSLYLFMQIRELGQKTVVILNMVDIAKTNGISIDAVELSKLLGCPVVETVANNNVNMDVLKEIIMNTLETGQKIISTRFRVSVSEAISNIEKSIDISGSTSKNYLAIKIAENDNYYTESLLKNERLLAIIQQENEKIAK